MAKLAKPTEKPQAEVYKLEELEYGLLKELANIQTSQFNQIRALMGAYLSAIAFNRWGYTEEQMLNFDIDLENGDGTVKVVLAPEKDEEVAPAEPKAAGDGV